MKASDFSSFRIASMELGLDRLSATREVIVTRSELSLRFDFRSIFRLVFAGDICGVFELLLSSLESMDVRSPYEELLSRSLALSFDPLVPFPFSLLGGAMWSSALEALGIDGSLFLERLFFLVGDFGFSGGGGGSISNGVVDTPEISISMILFSRFSIF